MLSVIVNRVYAGQSPKSLGPLWELLSLLLCLVIIMITEVW